MTDKEIQADRKVNYSTDIIVDDRTDILKRKRSRTEKRSRKKRRIHGISNV